MRLPRIVRTVTFKLALTQVALFAAAVVLLFVAVYWSMTSFAKTQLQAEVAADAAVLVEEAGSDGIPELIKTIETRGKERRGEGHQYLLLSATGQHLAGTLSVAESISGWRILEPEAGAPSTDDEAHRFTAFGQRLASGEYLLVGHDARDIDHVEEVLVETFAWASGVTLVLAIAGGVLTSLGFVRRVESINATSRRIMEGEFTKRVPAEGSGDEFDRLAMNLNEMLDRIQSLMEGLRQVSSDIAHDLRTPLTHLRQRLEAARSTAETKADYEAVVEDTIEDTDEILDMFAALLRIAQIEAGTRKSGFAEIDLSRVFTTILDVYGPVAEDAGQTLSASIEPSLVIRGDRELLMQMLANLVENAIRYAGDGASIQLTLEAAAAGLRATVSDTGPGIEPDLRDKVFRRFFRGESHRASEGSGLGLALVRAVADLHGVMLRLLDNAPGVLVEMAFPQALLAKDEHPVTILDGGALMSRNSTSPGRPHESRAGTEIPHRSRHGAG